MTLKIGKLPKIYYPRNLRIISTVFDYAVYEPGSFLDAR